MPANERRVVVTGLGAITPLALNVKDTWDAVLKGKSGVTPIDLFDVSAFSTRIAAYIHDFEPTDYVSLKEARKYARFVQYAHAASVEAIEDSGFEVTEDNAHRIGVAIGSGIGGLTVIETNYEAYLKGGPRKIAPMFIPGAIINTAAGFVSIKYGLQGPNISIVTACTTGLHNIGHAARIIQYGDADVMVAGGSERATCPLGVGGFAAARALSKRNDEPEKASRPFDRDRDGFVLGEGAGVLVLEEYEHAKKRGAHIYAEITGFGMSADAYHITMYDPDGIGASRAMKNALNDAQAAPESIDYINAHGTSTAGDVIEVKAMKQAFADHAYKLSVSSTKSMTGHLLGAAGSVEAIFCLLAMRDQVAPPTINLDNPGEGCDLDFVPHKPKEMKINSTMSNSFGFGGTNGSIIFRKI